jgi:hypothetical protein
VVEVVATVEVGATVVGEAMAVVVVVVVVRFLCGDYHPGLIFGVITGGYRGGGGGYQGGDGY